ncbi:MAG: DNA-protecting protein DprA, partial [Actinobacteria bacterium]|nr:DNA-protecting protein DprA [Actinomycetota bacterium]
GAAGAVVVSGAARGIDSASHEGALAAGASTWAVLGSGIDVAYPRSSASLIDRIAEVGSVISEYPCGVPAEPFRFPARNRIIAAVSSAVVLVEGAEHSGSLITAEHALDLGRDVFAVPGAVNNPLARAPLQSIHDGAGMIRGVDDLLMELGLADDRGAAVRAQMSLAEVAVCDLLPGPTLPEVVARELGCDMTQLMPILLSLEMRGLVRNEGGRFELTVAASSRTT